MRQKELFDGTKVPAVWQGAGGPLHDKPNEQVKIWVEGVRFGCNAIDTAERYGNGASEELVGEVIKHVGRENVFVATKVAPEHLSGPELLNACKHSLKRLGTDYIDLYQIHWNNPNIPLDVTLETMMQLKAEGRIRYIGVCNFTLPQIDICHSMIDDGLATAQMEYNLTNRLCERDVLQYCEQEGILFVGYSPLKSVGPKEATLMTIAQKHKRKSSQVILNWLTNTFNNAVIARTRSLEHLIENAQATEFSLDDEDNQKIDNTFTQRIIKLMPIEISCSRSLSGVEGDVPAYKTVEEAIANRHGLFPSPKELSEEVLQSRSLTKPIFVRQHKGGFDLVGGSVRYWAWVIAFGMHKEIECVVI